MKLIIGISGGVDSSVAALLLKQQGYDVEALFMKNWNEDEDEQGCSWEQDVEDALQTCDKLDIPINTVDLSREYWDKVFSLILGDFTNGLTPNPDILCNQEIKFRAFMDHALELGADRIATGHYARISCDQGSFRLLKGLDTNKDQSYFLCRLNQDQLSRSVFPVGDLDKTRVRQIAQDNGLSVHDKKDSTGICFIGERPFKEFLSKYVPIKRGSIRTTGGDSLGEHDGVHFYTIGQRQGLGIGGISGTDNEPWYVVRKDLAENILYVAQGRQNELLYSKSLHAIDTHWISAPPTLPFKCNAKTRYRQPDQACTIRPGEDDSLRIDFDEKQKSITPGQYIVFYDGDTCLGGAVILNPVH